MLIEWDEVAMSHDWKAILIGNGFSQHVWSGFSYGSLYEVATSVQHPLQPADEEIFNRLGTHDFERVLRLLRDAYVVNDALGVDTRVVHERYRAIQRALAEAVAKTHIPWERVPRAILQRIRQVLVRHRYVFTTNYDLLLYWSILCEEPKPSDVRDFFWTSIDERWVRFDPADTSVGPYVTRIFYLHGGLHLYSLERRTTAKYVPQQGENLLVAFRRFLTDERDAEAIPLIVTESDAGSKLAVIESSSYLTFAYEQLANCDSPLVVFGHSLGESDSHIARALNRHRDRPIAIGIHPPADADELERKKAGLKKVLPAPPLYFFDSTTHPLGDPRLRIDSGGSPD